MNAVWWFVAGFLTRGMFAMIAEFTRWRRWRRLQQELVELEPTTAVGEWMRWKLRVKGIVWDDNDGAHDVSRLPTDAEVIVSEDTEALAIERGLDQICDEYGVFISDTESIEVELLPTPQPPRRRRDDLLGE